MMVCPGLGLKDPELVNRHFPKPEEIPVVLSAQGKLLLHDKVL